MGSLGHLTNDEDVYLELEFETVLQGQRMIPLIITFYRCKNGISWWKVIAF